MSKKQKDQKDARPGIGVETVVIFRCGWCGFPCDKNGTPLEVDAKKYLDAHCDDKVKHVNGDCCPQGDGQQRQMVQVTREMALDAQMPEIEGTWIEW